MTAPSGLISPGDGWSWGVDVVPRPRIGVEQPSPALPPVPTDLTEPDVEQTIAAKRARVVSIDAEISALTRRRGALMDQMRELGRAAAGRRTGLYRRVEEIMAREPERGWKARELAQCLGGNVTTASVSVALVKMHQAGRIEKREVGVYCTAKKTASAA